jgi:dinuclear metal center YbgI/SA1388 family protein
MADRNKIIAWCNQTLDLHSIHDAGPMGLQFPGASEVKGVAAAVSVNVDVIDRAANEGANFLIVHHGLFWNNESRIDAPWQRRLEALEASEMTLVAYHLALDAHPKLGNNILLARNLGLGKLTPWEGIGWSGEYKQPMWSPDFAVKAHQKLDLKDTAYTCFFAGSKYVTKVAVIAGGAAQYVVNAHRDGFDTFVTGEPSEPSYNLANDLDMNFFAFGHDKTERSGVQALARQVSKRFRVPWTFIPSANPV